MGFSLRILDFQGLELPVHIGDVEGSSALFGQMPSAATALANGLGVIGYGPPLMGPAPRLCGNEKSRFRLISMISAVSAVPAVLVARWDLSSRLMRLEALFLGALCLHRMGLGGTLGPGWSGLNLFHQYLMFFLANSKNDMSFA